MDPSDRRIGMRIDLEMFLTEYVRDRPFRVLAANLSETGLYFHRVAADPAAQLVPAGTPVGLELELPGSGEVIWARGEVCREAWGRTLRGTGVRFADMPRCHARMVREYCHQKRRDRLDGLLAKIRQPRSAVPLPRRHPLA